jgi:hypothetical protein
MVLNKYKNTVVLIKTVKSLWFAIRWVNFSPYSIKLWIIYCKCPIGNLSGNTIYRAGLIIGFGS